MSDRRHTEVLRSEFERVSTTFAERTRGRFDELQVVEFARLAGGETVVEVGAGTGNFLQLFGGVAARLIAVDLTPGMLFEARRRHPEMEQVVADGARLPFGSRAVELVATAQVLHHIWEPLPILKEMRRVMREDGRVLIVDQVSTERYEEAVMMNKLEMVRDPSHAASRPPSALRTLLRVAGLHIVSERIAEVRERFSNWMWPGEFPEDRIERVKRFIDEHGSKTGMDFHRDGDDYEFERRRIMLLAERATP
ncbi:MAG: class I SAM-dependent methyltransferase [Actinomycetota bacterium]|nr:class I SAM-dependent methyltransferase [Actinomycetota bacterium]